MADLKISQLSSATALAGTEVVPVAQGGSTKKATIDQILSPAAGKGIDFSANGGDVLTQYDEGTWTPTLVSTGATFTYTQRLGLYTRIGRLVMLEFRILASASGTVTNGIQMTGLPFTSNSTGFSHGVVTCGYSDYLDGFPTGYVNTNATTFDIASKTGASSTPTTTGMNVGPKYFIGAVMYFT